MNNDMILNRYRELRVTRSKLKKKITLMTLYSILVTIICLFLVIYILLTPSNIINTDAVEVEPVEPVQTETLISEKYIATAYCACIKCCGKTDGITKSGTKATAGRTIAVDPTKIQLGSKVLIDGQEYIAEDVGGAIKGNRVDIFYDNHSDAIKYGRKTVNLTVIGDN